MAPWPATTHCSSYGLCDFKAAHQTMGMPLEASRKGANTLASAAAGAACTAGCWALQKWACCSHRDGAVLVV
jgi:hypothetical protein